MKKLSVPVENLRKDIRMRDESDPIMSTAWVLVYLIPIFAAITAIFTVFYFAFVAITTPWIVPGEAVVFPLLAVLTTLLLAIIGFIVFIILTYKLVKRRNTHFKRQMFLTEDVVTAVKTIAAKKGIDVEVGLSSVERTVREAKAEETEKGAVLWAILTAVPYIGSLAQWYVYYFLMKDFYKHERREDGFWEDLSRTLDKCGITFSMPRRTETTPNRSFVLYLILAIITLGLFGIYWLYVLLKDPNEHFKYHMQVEDQLLSTLESVAI